VVFRPVPGAPAPDTWYTKRDGESLPGATANQTLLPNGDYTLTYSVPWTSLGLTPGAGTLFGFDLAIDGPPAGSAGRKTQLALFGDASDAVDPSGFAVARLQAPGQ